MIRVRWNNRKCEVGFSVGCNADPEKWDNENQRARYNTTHKVGGKVYVCLLYTSCYFPPIHQLPGEYPGDSHTDSHKSEEESRLRVYSYLTGIHGYIIGSHAVRNRKQQQAKSGRQSF